MLLNILRDGLSDDELTTSTISQRELALDKELIQLIQSACKADRLARALDLTKLLHHTASFDMAARVAAFYHLIGLQEKIELLKAAREDVDRLEDARDRRRERKAQYAPVPAPRPPAVREQRATAFQDFRPPPEIHRPGLERATLAPSQNSLGAGPSRTRTAPPPRAPPAEDLQSNGAADDYEYDTGTSEGKRKRSEEPVNGQTKRRAVDDSVSSRLPSASKSLPAITRIYLVFMQMQSRIRSRGRQMLIMGGIRS